MKAYLIDPTTQTVNQVDWNGTLTSLKELLHCDRIDVARLNDAQLYVDDEGLFELLPCATPFFQYGGRDAQPLAGYALVVGAPAADGSETEPAMTLSQARAAVCWMTLAHVQEWARTFGR